MSLEVSRCVCLTNKSDRFDRKHLEVQPCLTFKFVLRPLSTRKKKTNSEKQRVLVNFVSL